MAEFATEIQISLVSMQNVFTELQNHLLQNPALCDEQGLLQNRIIDLTMQADPEFISFLLKSESIREHFFIQTTDCLVFNRDAFHQFISNKSFLPDSYTVFKNKIGLQHADGYVSENKSAVLAWPYKDCVLEGGQTKEESRQKEVFWNETLAPDEIDRLFSPKAFTNFRRYTADGWKSPEGFSETDSFIFRGNNLLTLHSIAPVFRGKVKLIYIDPPYNTGTDSFGYNDRFNHSSWLTFMKNRLEAAYEFLHPEGAIFIQIDDREMAYLKVLCDEIFGRENFKESIAVKNGSESGVNAINVMRGEQLFKVKEHILYYSKNARLHRFHPLYVKAIGFNDSYRLQVSAKNGGFEVTDAYKKVLLSLFQQDTLKGLSKEQKHVFAASFEEYCLAHSEEMYALKTDIQKSGETFKRFALANKSKGIVDVFTTADGRQILVYKGGMLTPLRDRIVEENGKRYYGTLVSDFWWDIGATPSAEGGVQLKAGKKPEKLLKRLLSLCTQKGDLVMDFFLGSGTTAAVAMKMGRRFIGIEQLLYGDNDPVIRLCNVMQGDATGISRDVGWKGGGSFVYAELLKWNALYIENILAADTHNQLAELFEAIMNHAFLKLPVTDLPADALRTEFSKLKIEDKKRFLIDSLDKNALYLPVSEIEDTDFEVDQHTIQLNQSFYKYVPSG